MSAGVSICAVLAVVHGRVGRRLIRTSGITWITECVSDGTWIRGTVYPPKRLIPIREWPVLFPEWPTLRFIDTRSVQGR